MPGACQVRSHRFCDLYTPPSAVMSTFQMAEQIETSRKMGDSLHCSDSEHALPMEVIEQVSLTVRHQSHRWQFSSPSILLNYITPG